MATLADLVSSLNFRPWRKAQPGWPRLILLTDAERLADPLPAAAALPSGAGVLLRHYDSPERATIAESLTRLCRARGLMLIVAGDARLALRVGATGVHFTEAQARARARRSYPRPQVWRRFAIVTAAAHSPAGMAWAARAGADAVLLSPVFPTPSHPRRSGLGIRRLTSWARQGPLPVYALGGVAVANARAVAAAGVVGIAGIGGLARGRRPVL